jgi:hypothetical protein
LLSAWVAGAQETTLQVGKFGQNPGGHSSNLRGDVGQTMISNFDPRCTHNWTPREIEE